MSSLLTPVLLSMSCVAPVAVDDFCSCKHTSTCTQVCTHIHTGGRPNKWRRGTKHHTGAGARTVQETELVVKFFLQHQ